MSQATNYFEGVVLDHIFGISAYTAPATMYLALFTAMSSGETPTATEVTGGSYARLAITNDATSWSRTSNVITNDNLLTFVTASANWGDASHWALFDASTAGNMLVYGEFDDPITINNGSTLRVAAGQLSVTHNAKSTYAAGKVLDHIFGITSWTVPATQYIGLFTAAPTDAGGGTEVTTSGTAYARESVTNSGSGWSRTTNTVTNDNDIEWAEATASYGTVVAVASFDASSAGNMLWWATKSPSETVGTGSIFAFAAGNLAYTLD